MHVLSTLVIIVASLLPASRTDATSPRLPPDMQAGAFDARMPAVVAICVDDTQPAWILLYGLSHDDPDACAQPEMERVAVHELPGLRRRLQTWLIREEQRESRIVDRVLALVGGQPGIPMGLTWDGGLAVTANDYSAAARRLAAYQADPGGHATEQGHR